jgi:CrcB protein
VRTALAISVAGALGALSRYALQAVIDPRSGGLPWGTFVVNVSGSFLIGLIFTVTTERLSVEPWLRTALTVGFLGAYTTFSTLAFETVRLLDGGEWLAAFLNMAGSAVFGVVAVLAGIVVARVVL